MRRFIMVTAAATAVATLSALSPATADAAGHALRAGSGASARAGQAAPGARLWFRQYNGPANGWNGASSVAVSRDGTRVFVTGLSQHGAPGANDYATVAYSAATGRNLWIRRYISGNAWFGALVAVSQTRVFVTGTILGRPGSSHYATVAYSAATGRKLWVRQFNDARGTGDAGSIAVNAAGTAVFVTGSGGTVAYRAATGRQLWTAAGGGYSVAVNHRGTAVFVADGANMAAYSAATGRQLWAWSHSGSGLESGFSVAVNAAGTVVFVTGTGTGTVPGQEYATAAYSASTGTQLWASYYTLPGDTNDSASSVVVNPAGTEVFVTGVRGTQYQYGGDYATVAYDAATGSQLWVRGYAEATYDQNNSEFLSPALALSPDGTTVYLTGSSGGYRTLAYNAATGRTLWARHYSDAKGTGDAAAIAVSPRGTAVFVTGTTGSDYGTIAYRS